LIDVHGRERLLEQGDRPVIEGMTEDQIGALEQHQ
jgi:hypothetical protein